MFASNQILEISGCFDDRDALKNALEFALKASGKLNVFTRTQEPAICVFQVTKDGKYCIGSTFKEIDGWIEYPFDFDIDIITAIAEQHLKKVETSPLYEGDGSYRKGFLLKVIPETFASELNGIKNPYYGILSIEAYDAYYSK